MQEESMSHRRSHGSHAVARAEDPGIAARGAIAREHREHAADAAVARWFYCDVLQGRQVWPSDRTADGALWFQVGNDLVTVRRDPEAIVIPARLAVDDPTAMAARCWDAGFAVQVRETTGGEVTFVVTDPFGRRIVLVPNGAGTEARPTTGHLLREEST
jgi:catechol 2,3-dioxygenase-like lactoylglutathione lyase family enzyme